MSRELAVMTLRRQLVLVFCLALVVRLVFYFFYPHIIRGDATTYSLGSYNLANGLSFDGFWYSFFYWWQWPFHLFFADKEQASIISTLLAGSLLVMLTVWISDQVFSSWRVNLLSAVLLSTHPRLIEYSINGYAEMVYTLFFTLGIAALIALHRNRGRSFALIWGVGFGFYFCLRQESVTSYFLSIAVFLLLPYFSRWRLSRGNISERSVTSISLRARLLDVSNSLLAFVVVVGAYVTVSYLFFESSGILQKSNVPALSGLPEGVVTVTVVLLNRLVSNVGIFLFYFPLKFIVSPILFFSIYCFYCRDSRFLSGSNAILLLMLFWPFLFFGMIIPSQDNYELRYYIAALIPLLIYAAQGFALLWSRFERQGLRRLLFVALLMTMIAQLGVAVYQGERLSEKNEIHFILADWLNNHVPLDEEVVGSRSGYIAETVYLSARSNFNYRPKSNDVDILLEFMRANDYRWLVLYEEYLIQFDPEMLILLERGIEGMIRVEEIVDPYSYKRVQIYRLLQE